MVVSSLVAARKLYLLSRRKVELGTIAVVYNSKRMSVFSTSVDAQETPTTVSARVNSFLFPSSSHIVGVPPLPWYRVFVLPLSIVLAKRGNEVQVAIDEVPSTDGNLSALVRLKYFIDPRELNRYLTVVGPKPPNEDIGESVAEVLKQCSSDKSGATLLSAARRGQQFAPEFRAKLSAKLCEKCCIRLIDVSVENMKMSD